MADCCESLPEKYKKPTSSFFISPRLFTNFTSKGLNNEIDGIMSPTSILDSKPFSCFRNPFWSETPTPTTPTIEHKRGYWERIDSKGVGLGIVDSLVDDKSGEFKSNPESRMVLFGSQLKIQIPPLPPPSETLKSSPDFEIDPENSPPVGKSASETADSAIEASNSAQVFKGCLSASEMELSEDYTRVISHGPNPRTTHIFDNCIIESCCFDLGFSGSTKENEFLLPARSVYPSESFLSFCFYCKKRLEQGKDIFMYR